MLKKEYHDGKLFFFLWMQAQIKVNPYKLLFPLCSPAAYVEKEEIRGRRESKSCGLRVCQHSSLFSLLVTTRISKGEFFFCRCASLFFLLIFFCFFGMFLSCFVFLFFWWRELKIVRGRKEKEAGDPAVSRPSKKKRVIASETKFFYKYSEVVRNIVRTNITTQEGAWRVQLRLTLSD